jgi:hypothetical protein
MRHVNLKGKYEPMIPIRQDFIKGQFFRFNQSGALQNVAGGLRQAYQFQQFSLNRIQLHCIHPVERIGGLGAPFADYFLQPV